MWIATYTIRTYFSIMPPMLRQILKFYTKYFVIWVVLLGVIAYLFPSPFAWMGSANKYFFSLTMFGIGAVLKMEDFLRIAKQPAVVLLGVAGQFTIMPFGAFIIARIMHLPPEITAGLVLTGSAPGAMASNVMSYIAKADTAYSVSLTTVSTMLCVILTPALTLLLAGQKLEIHFMPMFIDLMIMVIVPLFLGFGVRLSFAETIKKIEYIFPAISVTFIIFICALVIALNKPRFMMLDKSQMAGIIMPVIAAVVILNVYGMAAGYGLGRLFRLAVPRRRTLTIEIGMQNAGLGTVLAIRHFGPEAALPTAFFVFVCIITASILAEIWQRKDSIT